MLYRCATTSAQNIKAVTIKKDPTRKVLTWKVQMSLNEESPQDKIPNLQKMALSCTDSLPQAYGIENIALERAVRLVWVSVGLM